MKPEVLSCHPCNWVIWPETDGLEQKCLKCGKYRKTPEEDKFWKKGKMASS